MTWQEIVENIKSVLALDAGEEITDAQDEEDAF